MASRVGEVAFRPAPAIDRLAGLLGWASVEIGDLRLSGIAVRRTRDNRHVLSFPTRQDRAGREFTLVQPITAQAHHALESAILDELGRRGVLP